MEIDFKRIAKVYLLIFVCLMLIYCSVNVPVPNGEWDDYSLPIASILNSHKFGISCEDVMAYKQIYPNWSEYIDSYQLSGFMTKDGSREMAWYFPTYSIACIPYTILLKMLDLPTIYAFSYTNLTVLVIALVVLQKCLHVEDKKRLILSILLSINPIVFYIGWTAAEVLIYAMLIIALVAWYNRWYKRAALFVSMAGMLNPTIMSIGIVMILEYMFSLLMKKDKKLSWTIFIKQNMKNIFVYGACYIIGIIPMVYNYYNVGHINLTASLSGFTQGKESTIARFWAYLFDLNFGILPYYVVVVVVAFVLLIAAVIKKHLRYLQWFSVFLMNVLLYSVMTHINAGMSGIARYNAWGVLLLLFSVYLYWDEIITTPKIAKVVCSFLDVGIVLTGIVVMSYGPYLASNTSCVKFVPIAEWVMDNIPSIYNPLHSTYNSRILHVDGGYSYETPLTYIAEDGYVRKILASAKDKEKLKSDYLTMQENNEWLAEQIDKLGNSEEYISISKEQKVIQVCNYSLGIPILFNAENFSARTYVAKGLNQEEDWGAWTEGNEFVMRFKVNSNCELIHGTINCSVYNETQDVSIYVNEKMVYAQDDYTGGTIQFDFDNPGAGQMIQIKIQLPDATSPKELGYTDKRILGLGICDMLFVES